MTRNLTELLAKAKEYGPLRLAVAAAEDKEVLVAVKEARERGIATPLLVGREEKIGSLANEVGFDLGGVAVYDERQVAGCARRAVELVSSGQADLVMKGLMGTADILRAVLDKDLGLRTGRILSHVMLYELPGYDHLFFLTDGGMNLAPDLRQKADIVANAVETAHALGIAKPKVAVLAAVEVVNPDMPATLDAAALAQMGARGQIKGCVIDGPLALDNAISIEAAAHKGIVSPVAGAADILLVPDIEAGNLLGKAMTYFGHGKSAGMIVGARAPVVLVSRADPHETKLLSIALGVVAAKKK
ncbi:MAG TPA: phosphate butyryltransferase [Firmicutes bacterium]|nr:phosphate butyryltransferase [Bacillota bacterium]